MIEMSVIKAHCRLEPDFVEDDTILEAYNRASWRYIEKWTRRKLYSLNTDPGFDTDEDRLLLDDDIRVAMLLLIGHWYENREGVTVGVTATTVPLAVDALLQPYRIYGV
ncbi:phage gp6-like head-tail connector protein [Erwinia sp. S43]|uniref:head-tail connector protein n=1 Tax=Erwinia sp. S43 TaxID=2769339 RepID=UPI001909E678|nr:head-tail connector protein [Erwinia sp. S43]MBK0032745.1 phage gp6-like head-tail connector protein [Erwinia sp. S43]